MKKTLLFLLSMLALVSCYDDARLLEELQKHEDRIAALETLCSQMNTNISSMQSVVNALQTNDFITAVTPITEGNVVVGYTITFDKSAPITIYFGKDGEDGSDGVTPVISVRQDEDGIYYWTLNGEWMIDGDGNKIRVTGKDGQTGAAGESGADAVTPMLKIEDGWWYVSYNNGVDWQKLDKATGSDGESFFMNVSHDDRYVYFTLADGTVITVAIKTDADSGEEDSGDDDSSGDTQAIVKGPIILSLGEVTATTVTFNATLDVDMMADYQEVGLIYSKDNEMDVESETITKIKIDKESYYEIFTGLQYDTDYYYTVYTLRNNVYSYGATQTFKTKDVIMSIDDINVTKTTATFVGKVIRDEADISVKVGVEVSEASSFESTSSLEVIPEDDGTFRVTYGGLVPSSEYYCRTYVCQNGVFKRGETTIFTTMELVPVVPSAYTNLSVAATANCYIVSQSGSYCFLTAKGNRPSDLLLPTNSAFVLWESFGTSKAPTVGDLIQSVLYSDGYIAFQTAETFKEGNAVIAAKDVSGNIIWSWHIWFTDPPQEHIYNNNAGTMMDRNLGATSATPGDVGALGLLYQWGRKDPFLGSSSISSAIVAKSTITWPSYVLSSSSTGTIDYATANPTTFIRYNGNTCDWQYNQDNTRWQSEKTIYDPCPAGWRVPDGGSNGVWATAGFDDTTYDSTNEGISFSFSSPSTTWYPASGYRYDSGGSLSSVGNSGFYWSASPNSNNAYCLYFSYYGSVNPSSSYLRAGGQSVRCLQE